MNDSNYLQKGFIDEAKAAIDWWNRAGGSEGGDTDPPEPLVDGVYVWKVYTGVDVGLYSERDPLQFAIMSGFDSLKYAYGKPVVTIYNEFGEECGAYTINENELVLEKDGTVVSAPYTLLDDGITLECTDPSLFMPEGCFMNGVNVLLAEFKGYVASDDEFGYPNNGHDGQYYYMTYGHKDFRHGDALWLRMQKAAFVEMDEARFTLSPVGEDELSFYVNAWDFNSEGVRDMYDDETGEQILSWADFFNGFWCDYGYFRSSSTPADQGGEGRKLTFFATDSDGSILLVENYDYKTGIMTFSSQTGSNPLAGQDVEFICNQSFPYEPVSDQYLPKKYYYPPNVNNYTVGNWGAFEDGQEVEDFTMVSCFPYWDTEMTVEDVAIIPRGSIMQHDLTIRGKASEEGGEGTNDRLVIAFLERSLTDLVVPPETTKIADYAMYSFESLASVEFSNDNITAIGQHAFDNCINLTLTALPTGLTSIGNFAFSNCPNLALTELSAGVTDIGGSAFSSCPNLALTELPAGVTSIGQSAFYGCTSLALTELSDNLTLIQPNAFEGCTNLTQLEFPAGIITVARNAFSYCTGLTSITFKGTPTTIASSAFTGCTNLTTINVPWAEGEVANAPWGATNATINYNYTEG